MLDVRMMAPETWVDRHGDALYRFALRRVGDPDLAADLVQETYLEGLRARSSYSGRSSVRTWLTAILKHKIIDGYRRSGRGPKVGEGPAPVPAGGCDVPRRDRGEAGLPGRQGDDPDAVLDRREFWEVVDRCVLCLPEHLADAFVAIELGDLARDRACERFQITAANLSTRLHRARLMLRDCLESRGFAAVPPHARGPSRLG